MTLGNPNQNKKHPGLSKKGRATSVNSKQAAKRIPNSCSSARSRLWRISLLQGLLALALSTSWAEPALRGASGGARKVRWSWSALAGGYPETRCLISGPLTQEYLECGSLASLEMFCPRLSGPEVVMTELVPLSWLLTGTLAAFLALGLP